MPILELSRADDEQVDYCLWPYAPLSPVDGKLRSINLLMNSFADTAFLPQAESMIAAIRQAFGLSKTVWGIKQENGVISWELYFYDYGRRGRSRSITRLLEVIRPWMECGIVVNESCDYFMFSIDLNERLFSGTARLDELQLYMGNAGSTVSSGICYQVTKEMMTMKNLYFFFDAATQGKDIVDKITSSIYLDLERLKLQEILWPEMRGCQTIVVANKRAHDGIYFSRITIDQLLFFLKKMAFPDEQIAFAIMHRHRLDHLLYDVGIDYRMEDGQIKVLKSAYYGVF